MYMSKPHSFVKSFTGIALYIGVMLVISTDLLLTATQVVIS
jgi:hypothetical protein